MLAFPAVTVFIFETFLLEMHVSGKRACYIYFKGNWEAVFPVLQRSLKLTFPPTPSSTTKVSLEPRLSACMLQWTSRLLFKYNMTHTVLVFA